MIKLTEQFPNSIKIGEKNYAINTDYRIMANLETKISRADISDANKFAEIFRETISALFIEIPNEDIREIIKGVLLYYCCGKEPSPKKSEGGSKRCYDNDEDSYYLFAAFMQQYGDDLITSHMHWWEFRAKFTALTEETEFVKIMQYRSINISKIKNKEERARIKKLQERFALKSQKPKKFADVESRDEAMKQKLQKRFEEVQKQAGGNK